MTLQMEIAAGRQLMESEDAPMFVSEAVTALVDTVNKTSELANLKYQSLKVLVVLKVLFWHYALPILAWKCPHLK